VEEEAMNLKPYMGSAGEPEEGAVLIFATSQREAKKIFWQTCQGDVAGDDYLCVRVTRLRDKDWLITDANQAFLLGGKPHVVVSPKSCKCCGCWGHEPIEDSGLCDTCLRGDCDNTYHI
jgi:hypothetical protein